MVTFRINTCKFEIKESTNPIQFGGFIKNLTYYLIYSLGLCAI